MKIACNPCMMDSGARIKINHHTFKSALFPRFKWCKFSFETKWYLKAIRKDCNTFPNGGGKWPAGASIPGVGNGVFKAAKWGHPKWFGDPVEKIQVGEKDGTYDDIDQLDNITQTNENEIQTQVDKDATLNQEMANRIQKNGEANILTDLKKSGIRKSNG